MFLCNLRISYQDIFFFTLAPLLIKNQSISFLAWTNREWRSFLYWNYGPQIFKMHAENLVQYPNIWKWAIKLYPKLLNSNLFVQFCAEMDNCSGVHFLIKNKKIKFFEKKLKWIQPFLSEKLNIDGIIILFENKVNFDYYNRNQKFMRNADIIAI